MPTRTPPALYIAIGRRIRKARESRRCSQEMLARAIGLTRTSISNIESGRQHVPIHTLYAIAEALGLQPTLLLPTLKLGEEEQVLVGRLARRVTPDLHGWVASVVSKPRREIVIDAEP